MEGRMFALTYLWRTVTPVWIHGDLRDAITTQDVDLVQRLIASGTNTNDPLPTRSYEIPVTPLELALKVNCLPIIQSLLTAGANPNAPPAQSTSVHPLIWAAQQNQTNAMQLLLANGAVPNTCYNGSTPLKEAVSRNNIPMARMLLDAGADANLGAPLFLAVRGGHLGMVELLVGAGAHLEDLVEHKTVLGLAASLGNAAMVQQLLLLGAEVNPPECTYCYSPLFLGVKNGNLAVVRRLILAGAQLERNSFLTAVAEGYADIVREFLQADVTRSLNLREAITSAVQKGRAGIVRMLIDAGAAVDVKLLHEAVVLENEQIVSMLAQPPVDVNALHPLTSYSNATALHVAVKRGNERVVQVLLRAGASLEIPSQVTRLYEIPSPPQTPLILALQEGTREMAAFLIAAGAGLTVDRSSRDEALYYGASRGFAEIVERLFEGRAPATPVRVRALYAAASGGHLPIVQLLIGRETSMNDSETGSTPLMGAAAGGHIETVRWLLAHGANRNTSNNVGMRAVDYAWKNGHGEIGRFLLLEGRSASDLCQVEAMIWAARRGCVSSLQVLSESGVSVNCTDGDRSTPLIVAAKTGHAEAVRWLLAHGARRESVDKWGLGACGYAKYHNHSQVALLVR